MRAHQRKCPARKYAVGQKKRGGARRVRSADPQMVGTSRAEEVMRTSNCCPVLGDAIENDRIEASEDRRVPQQLDPLAKPAACEPQSGHRSRAERITATRYP